MKRNPIYILPVSLLACLLLVMTSCEKKDYVLPTAKDVLQNDAIKRSLGPNIVNDTIEFVYAMGILPSKGKLASAEVEASIAGATGTFLEHRSYYTNTSGVDVPVEIGNPSVNDKTKTTVTFTKDTSAAALRYTYIVPEEARGKTVSFTFTARSSNGETVNYKLGPYNVSKMDIKHRLTVSNANNAYISIEDMAVYNDAGAAANANKIDLVYLYRTYTTSTFTHALVAPAADPQYLPDITLPAGVNRNTKIQRVFSLQDYDLAFLQFGIYIDDRDFQELDLTNAPNYAINLKAEAGIWVETADKKYRAYVYINSINNGAKSAVISIKRYPL
jgi:hypothetical protein